MPQPYLAFFSSLVGPCFHFLPPWSLHILLPLPSSAQKMRIYTYKSFAYYLVCSWFARVGTVHFALGTGGTKAQERLHYRLNSGGVGENSGKTPCSVWLQTSCSVQDTCHTSLQPVPWCYNAGLGRVGKRGSRLHRWRADWPFSHWQLHQEPQNCTYPLAWIFCFWRLILRLSHHRGSQTFSYRDVGSSTVRRKPGNDLRVYWVNQETAAP